MSGPDLAENQPHQRPERGAGAWTSTRAENYAQQVAEHGYVVIEGAVSRALVDELRSALDSVEREHALGYAASRFEGYNTVRIYNLLAYGEPFWQVPLHEQVLPVAERVLEPELLLSSLSAITLGPRSAGATIARRHSADPARATAATDSVECDVGFV